MAFLATVILRTPISQSNLNPLILAELLMLWTIPVVDWVQAHPLKIFSDARRADKFLVGLRRVRVGHHGDKYFCFCESHIHVLP